MGDRITFVPRYRQRIASVPGHVANPVWVDDPDFDLGYHVRRSALPRPGTPDQLFELVARIIARPLDRHRPLWEVYFIEGLEEGRVAVLSKSHEVLVDGVHTVDLAQVLLDRSRPTLGRCTTTAGDRSPRRRRRGCSPARSRTPSPIPPAVLDVGPGLARLCPAVGGRHRQSRAGTSRAR